MCLSCLYLCLCQTVCVCVCVFAIVGIACSCEVPGKCGAPEVAVRCHELVISDLPMLTHSHREALLSLPLSVLSNLVEDWTARTQDSAGPYNDAVRCLLFPFLSFALLFPFLFVCVYVCACVSVRVCMDVSSDRCCVSPWRRLCSVSLYKRCY